ncbi:MAG: hypothetical protein GX130_05570 [Candidatus Hydrogenedens sp.]|nr:hypothetical protein [Candidatus Hydrogenedens sp.]
MNTHRNFKTCLLSFTTSFSLLVCCLAIFQVSSAAETIDTESVLKAFRESVDWPENMAVKQTTSYGGIYQPDNISNATMLYHEKNERLRFIHKSWEMNQETGVPDEYYHDGIWIPEMKGVYILGSGSTEIESLQLYDDSEERSQILYNSGSSRFYQGLYNVRGKYLQNDLTMDRVNEVARGELEGQASVIIEAELPDGHLTLWLSPEEGYTMQKWRLVKEVGKHVEPDRVTQPSQAEKTGAATERSITEYIFYDRQIVDGFNVPMEMKKLRWIEYGDEKEMTSEVTSRLSDIQFNPDFDALSVFEVPDYSHIEDITLFRKDRGHLSNLEWNEGSFRVKVPEVNIEKKLAEGADAHKSEKTKEEEKIPERISLNLGASEESDAFIIPGLTRSMAIAGAASVSLLFIVLVLLWRVRRKK